MKIRVEHCDMTENEVVLRCPSLDDEMLHVLALLSAQRSRLFVLDGGATVQLAPDALLYAEAVDDKTFLSCADAVYETALTLAELEARYEPFGYCRIGKSVLLNLYRIARLQSLAGGRIEAVLENGDKQIVSRHYAPLLRQKLGL